MTQSPVDAGSVSQLEENCALALDLISAKNSRAWMITFDDTTYSPVYSLVHLAFRYVAVIC